MDDKECMTLSQLANYQVGDNNDITIWVLSTNDCGMKNLVVESDKLNNDTSDDSKVNNKTEENLSRVDSLAYSEL